MPDGWKTFGCCIAITVYTGMCAVVSYPTAINKEVLSVKMIIFVLP